MLATAEEEVGLRALCTSEELGESLIRRRQELDLLELMWSRDAGRFAATKEYERDGFNSPYDWMRVNCHMNLGQVLDRVSLGEQVSALPDSVQSVLIAQMRFQHSVVISATAGGVKESDTAGPFEE